MWTFESRNYPADSTDRRNIFFKLLGRGIVLQSLARSFIEPSSDRIEVILVHVRQIHSFGKVLSYLQMEAGFLELSPDSASIGVTWPIYEIWQGFGGYRARSPEFREFLESELNRRTLDRW